MVAALESCSRRAEISSLYLAISAPSSSVSFTSARTRMRLAREANCVCVCVYVCGVVAHGGGDETKSGSRSRVWWALQYCILSYLERVVRLVEADDRGGDGADDGDERIALQSRLQEARELRVAVGVGVEIGRWSWEVARCGGVQEEEETSAKRHVASIIN